MSRLIGSGQSRLIVYVISITIGSFVSNEIYRWTGDKAESRKILESSKIHDIRSNETQKIHEILQFEYFSRDLLT